jgi:site-specific DNA-cytosine methylase
VGGGGREPKIAALRGRNPDNPSERGKSNGNYKQILEMNENGTSNTLTSVQKDNLVVEPQIMSRIEIIEECKDINYEEINEANTRKVLRLLRSKVGEEKIQWAFGRFVSIFKEEILRQGVYEEGICERGEYDARLQPSASFFSEDNVPTSRQRDGLRDVRSNQEYRCASQGFQLSEQFTREFNGIVSQLPYEDTPSKECLSYLWQTCKGLSSMQQTLLAMEEIRRPVTQTLEHVQPPKYRIRKLTCREVFRLMGVDDKDIDTIQAAGISNSQQYKMAGNSIVVDVLYHQFVKAFIDRTPTEPFYQQTLF